jgi:hypothetical protein
MFAEDVGLLPDHLFTKMLEVSRRDPAGFAENAQTLFGAMAQKGGKVGFTAVDWFNGGLFEDDHVLPVSADDLDELREASRRDWSQIDPSILGTLFERGLDPAKRSQLGAHYTDREKIMMIVRPVIIEPLEREWSRLYGPAAEAVSAAHAEAEVALAGASGRTELAEEVRALEASLKDDRQYVLFEDLSRQKRFRELDSIRAALRQASRTVQAAQKNARRVRDDFLTRLREFRVLDPACGSGNFLYVALNALKDIENKVNIEAELLGVGRSAPLVGPESVLGIEINPYAAELARVSVWIGEIQWMRRNGFDAAKNPILRPLETIECRDAILNEDGTRAEWPLADVVIGNPPFLGAEWMLDRLGQKYTEQMRRLLPRGSPASDLVTFWFVQAARAVDLGVRRVGFVATNMIRSPANAVVAEALYTKAPILLAQSDEPWVVDGADVRVSLVVCSAEKCGDALLDGNAVKKITPDLKGLGIDLRARQTLGQNRKRAVRGVEKGGPFELDGESARKLLSLPTNPNGLKNAVVIKRYATVADIVSRGKDEWIVDFSGFTLEEASLFEGPFAAIETAILRARAGNRDPRQLTNWWLFRRTGDQAKAVLSGKHRVLSTGLVTKHRVFRWLDTAMIPDTRVILIDTQADVVFGILSSRFHEVWSLATCQFHGVGNDPVYTPGDCFESFAFPDGLTPDVPPADYAAHPRAEAIAAAAARLNKLRENWLNPPDLVVRQPEVVPGYPERILAKDEEAWKELKRRTLTNLYNGRPQWLENAHAALDESVAEAYGWGDDWRGGLLTDDEILARLFRLNQERDGR